MKTASVFAVMLLLICTRYAAAQDLSKHFEGIHGTFVLLNSATGQYVRHDTKRAAERFPPCSTFKIPNTAILLETGAARHKDHLLKYDPALKQSEYWAHDQTLESAFRTSALWYYQVLASQLGLAVETKYVQQFRYGNQSTAGGVDLASPFWIDGSLRISANEQVEFLKNFYEAKLGLSERTTRLTREIMVAEHNDRWRLSAKTGVCQPTGEDATLWYVGYVERGKAVYYFAMQMVEKEFGELFKQRASKPRQILAELGVLD
jgi:beta-lactamase class D